MPLPYAPDNILQLWVQQPSVNGNGFSCYNFTIGNWSTWGNGQLVAQADITSAILDWLSLRFALYVPLGSPFIYAWRYYCNVWNGVPGAVGVYPGSGFIVTDCMPGGVCVEMQRITGVAGRSGRGRVYMGAPPKIFLSGNRLNTLGNLYYRGLATFMEQPIVTPFLGITINPCLASYKNHTLTPITEVRVKPTITCLHKRMRPRRVNPPPGTYKPI